MRLKIASISFLLFLLQFIGFAHFSVSPTVEVDQTQSSFIEDQKTTFVCKIRQSDQKITGIWFLRDPITKIQLFLRNKNQRETIRKKFNGNKLVLHLVMRRDFSGMELVCQISNGEKDSYLLPDIQKTIPVERVRFIPTFYDPRVSAEDHRIWCEVKAKRGVVKHVLVRTQHVIFEAAHKENKNNDTSIYEMITMQSPRELNGLIAQCIAVTDEVPSNKGHVTSPLIYVSLPEFKKPSSTVEVQKGHTKKISFGLKTRATPVAKNFDFVVQSGNANSRHTVKADFKVESNAQGAFEVTANISPKRSGNYTLRYNSGIFNTTSQPLLVKVLYFEFAINSSSGLNANSSFWTEFHVRKNEISNITIPVKANPKPDRHFFHLFIYENSTVLGRRVRQDVLLKNVQVNEAADGSERELFQVFLEFLPQRSGPHGIMFNDSRGFYVKSKPFYVHLHYLEFASSRHWSSSVFTGYQSSALIEFRVKAEPFPEKNHFSVHCGDETVKVVAAKSQVTRTSVADHQYRVSISFIPTTSWRCKVHYNSNHGVSVESMEYIMKECFANIQIPNESRLIRMKKGYFVKFPFWAICKDLPTGKDFHVLQISSDGKSIESVPSKSNVTRVGVSRFLIRMTFWTKKSGNFRIEYRKHGMVVDSHVLVAKEAMKSGGGSSSVVITILVLILVLFVAACIFVCFYFLYSKKKSQARMNRTHWVPACADVCSCC